MKNAKAWLKFRRSFTFYILHCYHSCNFLPDGIDSPHTVFKVGLLV